MTFHWFHSDLSSQLEPKFHTYIKSVNFPTSGFTFGLNKWAILNSPGFAMGISSVFQSFRFTKANVKVFCCPHPYGLIVTLYFSTHKNGQCTHFITIAFSLLSSQKSKRSSIISLCCLICE